MQFKFPECLGTLALASTTPRQKRWRVGVIFGYRSFVCVCVCVCNSLPCVVAAATVAAATVDARTHTHTHARACAPRIEGAHATSLPIVYAWWCRGSVFVLCLHALLMGLGYSGASLIDGHVHAQRSASRDTRSTYLTSYKT